VKTLDDLARLRNEYEDRKHRYAGRDIYSSFNPAHLFEVHGRQRAVLRALKRQGLSELGDLRILEMGCGGGGVLAEYLAFGAAPCNLYGVDLLGDRLAHARHWLPGCQFANGDGQSLPFRSQSFDLVLQYTALSSVLDPELRHKICSEMLRVLRSPEPVSGKPGGLILSYDFWLNPTNRQTHGLRPKEIRESFPGCHCTFERITLAPPVARRLVSFPGGWGLCLFLESLKVFNTHTLAVIRRS
jgi:SAM-dependent methyltransferase